MAGRTFRVFVSSTFRDLVEERNALARWVFPRLRARCEARGYKFQAVDLRWGVREEAAADQQTLAICLEEIARCQNVSPKPNFIILLGDRYGWCPPPARIAAADMESLRRHFSTDDAALIFRREDASLDDDDFAGTGWYRLDENAIPPEWVLQPRRGRYEAYDTWEPVERRLRGAITSATRAGGLSPEHRDLHGASATELEIVEGALRVPDAREHVFAFVRSIKNRDEVAAALPASAAAELLDVRDGTWDQEARAACDRLKTTLCNHLGLDNVWEYAATWRNGQLDRSSLGCPPADCEITTTADGLEPGALCYEVFRRLSAVIEEQMKDLDRSPSENLERDAHIAFAKERLQGFCGRKKPLARISKYLRNDAPRPLVVHAESGSGKSALMARAAEIARFNYPQAIVIQRYIGAVPGASEARPLLESLCRELSRDFDADETPIDGRFDALIDQFPKLLSRARADKPVILFLDALDQMGDVDGGRRLAWLPHELPPHVRVVVSTLPEDRCECMVELRMRAAAGAAEFLELKGLRVRDGEMALSAWLMGLCPPRKLTTAQRSLVLAGFRTNGLPLYLRLAFEHARHWPSFLLVVPESSLPAYVTGLVRRFFAHLSRKHGVAIVSRVLSFLAAARYGLTDTEILELLWGDAEVKEDFYRNEHHRLPDGAEALPPVIWSRLRHDLEPYLAHRELHGIGLLAFFHRQLAEVAHEDFLASNRQQAHAVLSSYFATRWQIPDTHALLELPRQQLEASGESPSLLDLDFIETKIGHGLFHDLLADYEEARSRQDGNTRDERRSRIRAWARSICEPLDSETGDLLSRRLEWTPLPEAVPSTAPAPPEEDDRFRAFEKVLSAHAVDFLAHGRNPFFVLDHLAVVGPEWMRQEAGKLLAHHGPDRPRIALVATSRNDERSALLASLPGTYKSARLAISVDGSQALIADQDGMISLFDLDAVRLERRIVATDRKWRHMAASFDWNTAILCDNDRIYRLNLRTFELRPLVISSAVGALAISADARLCVIAHGEGDITTYDSDDGEPLVTWRAHDSAVKCLGVSVHGLRLLTIAHHSQYESHARVWELTPSGPFKTLDLLVSSTECGALFSDGSQAILHIGKCVWVDVETGVSSETDVQADQVIVSADGLTQVSWNKYGEVCVWRSRAMQSSFVASSLGGVGDVAVNGDGSRILTFGSDGIVRLWDGASSTRTEALAGHWLHKVEWSPGGEMIAAAARYKPTAREAIQIHEGVTLEEIASFSVGPGVLDLAWKHSERAVVAGGWDRNIYRCSVGSKQAEIFGRHEEFVSTVAISPDEAAVITAGDDSAIRVWDYQQANGRHRVIRRVRSRLLALTPDGRFAIGVDEPELEVYDTHSGGIVKTGMPDPSTGPIVSIISEMGGRGVTLRTRIFHEGDPDSSSGDYARVLVLSRDGRFAASAHQNQLVVWDLSSGEKVRSMPEGAPAEKLAFLPGSMRLVAGGSDGTLWLIELDEPGLGRKRELGRHSGAVGGLTATADGRHVVSVGDDRFIRVWSVDSLCCVAESLLPEAAASISTVHPSGRFVVGTSQGRLFAFKLMHLPEMPPIAYATPLWLHRDGRCDASLTWFCAWCGKKNAFGSWPVNEPVATAPLSCVSCHVVHKVYSCWEYYVNLEPRAMRCLACGCAAYAPIAMKRCPRCNSLALGPMK